MILKQKEQIAQEYLKKCLVQYSTNFTLLADLLLAYSKLIRKLYTTKSDPIQYFLDQVKRAAVPVSDSLYDNLVLFVQLHYQVEDQKALAMKICQEKLQNGDRQKTAAGWIELIKCLTQWGEFTEARRAYERGMLAISGSAILEKETLVQAYSKLVTSV